MRYHLKKPDIFVSMYGSVYRCDHPVYSRCTLYLIGQKGLAVIQQRFDAVTKKTWWEEIDPWLTDILYLHPKFKDCFDRMAGEPGLGIYPTVTVRKLMWALKMKHLQKERWETVFDRKLL